MDSIIYPLIAGFILDAFLGDPHKMPHPIRLFGKAISLFDKKVNRGEHKRAKGFITVLILLTLTYLTFELLIRFANMFDYLRFITPTIIVYYGLANRSLIDEVLKTEKELLKNSIVVARKKLSYIVGRDTKDLNPKQMRTALLETLAENLSDGVVAPILYYVLGGVPLMMTYKMVNTLDSMIGYKNERYRYFGYTAAKLDDILNYIPARITAGLIVLLSMSRRGLLFIFSYGHKHPSPNAGYPEAALAGVLNCRLCGPSTYQNRTVNKPYIGANNREITSIDIKKSCFLNFMVAVASIIIVVLIDLFLYR